MVISSYIETPRWQLFSLLFSPTVKTSKACYKSSLFLFHKRFGTGRGETNKYDISQLFDILPIRTSSRLCIYFNFEKLIWQKSDFDIDTVSRETFSRPSQLVIQAFFFVIVKARRCGYFTAGCSVDRYQIKEATDPLRGRNDPLKQWRDFFK